MDYSYVSIQEPTFVTGLWDIGRGSLENTAANHDWARSFEKYTLQLRSLLSSGLNIIVYGEKNIQKTVEEFTNAKFVEYDRSEFYKCRFYDTINTIRTSKEWYDQPTAQWLKNSPQAKLPLYAPITFQKIHFIQKAKEFNPFHSQHFYWIDAGITKNHDIVVLRDMLPKLAKYSKFLFFSLHYPDNTEIHGFLREGIHKYCNRDFVEYIMKGFFFGGDVRHLSEILALFDTILSDSLAKGYLGTEESIFTIMSYQKPDLFDQVRITSCANVPQFL
jgi:hypothetical protein